MKTNAVRLYGKMDLKLEEFELPDIKDDEILVQVIADSICMSTLKAVSLGAEHKRVPDDVDKNPIIIGHEFSGIIRQIGSKWKSKYTVGGRFSLQPALNYKGSMDSPGYSYRYCGGDATYAIIPPEVMELDCLIPYSGEDYFRAALSEPYSCVIGACRSMYRTNPEAHTHEMGLKKDGVMAILGGCGPMGLAAMDYAMSCEKRPSRIVITDMVDYRIRRAKSIFSEKANKSGVELIFINPAEKDNSYNEIMEFTGNRGFDDILVMVISSSVLEEAFKILAYNGCLNFFAGPTDNSFSATVNYYEIHYAEKHIIGTTGGNAEDMREALKMMEKSELLPESLITHIGGLDAVSDSTLNLDKIPGGKKLIYTNISMPLTSLEDIQNSDSNSELLTNLKEFLNKNNGLWSTEAEKYLLVNAVPISR
ncbi:MAG: zinc-binding dehydrogenase [Spirochaetes bacterium]|nr:zinc-binding dehydrogenase [Spirochaetota bacterium]